MYILVYMYMYFFHPEVTLYSWPDTKILITWELMVNIFGCIMCRPLSIIPSFFLSLFLSLDCLWKGSVYCTTLVQFEVFLVKPTYPSHCCCLSSWLFRRQYAELSSPLWAPVPWTSFHSGSGTGHASAGSPSAPSGSSAAPWKCPASFSRKSSALLTRVRHYRVRI